MEEPGRMAKWVVPLVVEPLIDESWDAKYNWDHIMEGAKVKPDAKLKDWQFREGDRAYGIPPFLQGLVQPPWLKGGLTPPEGTPPSGDTPPPPPAPPVPAVPTMQTTEAPATPQVQKPQIPTPAPAKEETIFWKLGLASQTRNAVHAVAAAAMTARVIEGGKILHVVSHDDHLLVDPKLQIRVDPERFKHEMFSRNL
jgi:hypothetical protein